MPHFDRFTERLYNTGVESGFTDFTTTWMTFRFGSIVNKPFVEWDAYSHGLIDERGNLLRTPVTTEERNSLTTFDNLIRKVKRAITRNCSEANEVNKLISLYLVKQESYNRHDSLLKIEIADDLENEEIELMEDLLMRLKNHYNL